MYNQEVLNLPTELHHLAKDTLKFIGEHDGKWSWYQLGHVLVDDENIPVVDRLMEVINQLEADNMIRSDFSQSTSMPKYWLTENGRKFLQQN